MDFELCIRAGQSCADLAAPKPHFTASGAAAQVISGRETKLISISHK
jgi:hypothetical protein